MCVTPRCRILCCGFNFMACFDVELIFFLFLSLDFYEAYTLLNLLYPSLISLSILHASLRGNKVSHIPFYLSSPKDRKGRSVMLRKVTTDDVYWMWLHVEIAPCSFSLHFIRHSFNTDSHKSRQMCQQCNNLTYYFTALRCTGPQMFPLQLSCSLPSLSAFCSIAIRLLFALFSVLAALAWPLCLLFPPQVLKLIPFSSHKDSTETLLCLAEHAFLSLAAQLRRSLYSMM